MSTGGWVQSSGWDWVHGHADSGMNGGGAGVLGDEMATPIDPCLHLMQMDLAS